jgi:hypothetical protein
MKKNAKCPEHSLIDAHFRGKVAAAQEQAMREHMINCDDCRAYYKRKLLLAKLDPKGLDSQTRLARGLGVSNRSVLLRPLALVAVASAVLVFMVIWHQNTVTTGNDSFIARGDNGSEEATRLWIYRVHPGQPAVAADDAIDVTDELAFAYENAENKKYLMVFGIDEHKNVYWYHPEWQASMKDPKAVSVSKKLGIQELPTAVRHQLKGDTLRIVGVFTDQPITVKQVEALIRESEGLQIEIPLKGAIQVIRELKVRH